MKRKLSSLIAAVFIGIGAFSCICQAAGMDIDKEDGKNIPFRWILRAEAERQV